MNKKDLGKIRKNFKVGSTLTVPYLTSVYLKRDSGEVLYTKDTQFQVIGEEEQKVYLDNFKKVLSGGINVKLFDLPFKPEGDSQEILQMGVSSNDVDTFNEFCNEIVSKIVANFNYDTDVVINIAKMEHSTEEAVHSFVICTVNKAKIGERAFVCDCVSQDFTLKRELDPIINVKAPLDGFMYPVWEDDRMNVNKVLDYNCKPNCTNVEFISEVLNAEVRLTEKEEREAFREILKQAIGHHITPEVLHNIYSIIHTRFEGEEDLEARKINCSILQQVISSQGLTLEENLEDIFFTVTNVRNYQFAVDSVIPDFTKKSIEIKTTATEIKTSPEHLSRLKQVQDSSGKIYCLVELEEVMRFGEGFDVKTEEVTKIRFEEE